MHVVRVFMRVQHGIQLPDSLPERLEAQFRRCVDEDGAVVRLDQCAASSSLVSRVGRPAYSTPAPDLGNSHRGPRPEQGEAHPLKCLDLEQVGSTGDVEWYAARDDDA